ncbi:MAG: 3-dehydroquinate synthase [Verrucomicrobia bacterium]|nr:3-dehydroquinate synthase [Verrucomicrobiota bacterium]
MKSLEIKLNSSCSIYLGAGLFEKALLVDFCRSLSKRLVIISDDQVPDEIGLGVKNLLDRANLDSRIFYFPAGEIHKTRETKAQLENVLLDHQYGRDTCLLALGGGVTTDLVGFLASTYCRGIPFVSLPTTLLAMVDASIGGKTGVNTRHGKNLIGTFYQPLAVFMEIDLLKTLPTREWNNGVVELIKHGLIADADLFYKIQASVGSLQHDPKLLLEIIHQSCLIKKNIVARDEKESGMRQWLNYGHTIGHAVESIEEYQLSHGEAIAIGLLVETKLSIEAGLLGASVLSDLKKLLAAYQLPLKTRAFQNKERFLHQLQGDKKSKARTPHFVMLNKIGKAREHGCQYAFPVAITLLEEIFDWAALEFAMC